jgi:hypothetical protein
MVWIWPFWCRSRIKRKVNPSTVPLALPQSMYFPRRPSGWRAAEDGLVVAKCAKSRSDMLRPLTCPLLGIDALY